MDKKTWYPSSPNSSTRKSGRFLYCSETVFLGKIFPKLMVMGHFAPGIIRGKEEVNEPRKPKE